jgi:NitT/TauT family transport system substrate-binding protein
MRTNAWKYGLLCATTLLSGAASAQSLQTATLAWTPNAEAAQIAIASERGYWKEAGIEMKSVSFPTGREALEALLGGQVDFAALAELPAVIGAMRGQKFAVIAILTKYRANRVVMTTDLGAPRISALSGRRVGTTLGTNAHYMTDFVLGQANVKAQIVNVAPPDIVAALVRGDIDAAVMFPAFFAPAKRSLGARYAEVMTPEYQTHFLIAGTTDVVEKRPDAVRRVLNALVSADKFLAADAPAAQASIVKSVGRALTTEQLAASWPDYEFRVSLEPSLLTLMRQQGEWIQRTGLIKDAKPSEALFRSYLRPEPLRAVAPDRVAFR